MKCKTRFITIFIMIFILSVMNIFAQNIPKYLSAPCITLSDQAPRKVYRLCYIVKPKDWYRNQEKLWQAEISRNPENEEAWYNYFFAARYGWADIKGQALTRDALMDSIYVRMRKAIPDSWVYHYIHYYNDGTDFSRLEKAYEINPNAPDLYWEFIKEYTLNGQSEKRREFCRKLYESRDISTGVLNVCFNLLNSAEENSILFTNGDTDTYPSWVLQEAKGVRRDVLILTVHGIFGNRDYLKSILESKGIRLDLSSLSETDVGAFLQGLIEMIRSHYPEVPIYLARTVYSPYYEHFKDRLHLTGLVLTYHDDPFDSEKRNCEIIENRLRLDYLDADWYADLHVSQPMVDQLNLLYVDPFLKLTQYYQRQNDRDTADRWREKALILARRADDKESIKKIEASRKE